MYLRAVDLVNWRSYRRARFEFPEPFANQNVILIRAPNEYGKTSFFEAVVLGLFGRDGLNLVRRAVHMGVHAGEDNRLKLNYSQFLSTALHHQASESGPTKCSVSIEVEDDIGEPIELTRTWYFRQNRQHKPNDDDLNIYLGVGREPVTPPFGVEDRDEWLRDWIVQRFLPPSLARFFLFDGEHIQQYANREMHDQVREGIDGLLGLPILRKLKASLDVYAKKQRSLAGVTTDGKVKQLESEIGNISKSIECHKKIYDKAENALPELESKIKDLIQAIGGRETVDAVGIFAQEEQRFRGEAERAMQALRALIQGDVALAIAGSELVEHTQETLKAEATLERWEAGRDEGEKNFDRFVLELDRRIDALSPPLDKNRHTAVVSACRAAWNALWHPAPEDCAEHYRHPSLMGLMRDRAIELLQSLYNHTEGELVGEVERYNYALERAEAAKGKWREHEATAPEVERLTAELKKYSEEKGRYTNQRDEADKAIRNNKAVLVRKKAELGRYLKAMETGEAELRRADYAERYAILINILLNEAIPMEVGEVAKEMTKAWKAMAHLSDRIERIEITHECEVRMLTAENKDLHEIDKSAGASQVFTQALILAITKVSCSTFPFIVDTPLARLSYDQRIGVLKTFTDRPGQVILLSTDEEIVGDKLDVIRERLLAAFELRVQNEKGLTLTSVHQLTPEKL